MRPEHHLPRNSEASSAALSAARDLALVTGRLILWTYQPATQALWWSDDPGDTLKLLPTADELDVGRWLLRPLLDATDALETWSSYECDRVIADSDGNDATLVVRARSVVEPDGTLAIGGVVADMTERRLAESALRELADRYRLLIDLIPDAIVVHQRGIIRYVNPAGNHLMRLDDPERLVGQPIVDFVHPDSVADMLARITALDEPGVTSSPAEMRLVRDDGTSFMCESTSVRTTWDGQPAFQVILRDLTERDALQKQFAAVVAALDEGVIVIDDRGQVSVVNRSARRLLGHAADGVRTGRELVERLSITDADGFPIDLTTHPVSRILRDGQPQKSVVLGVEVDGLGRRWFSANFQPLFSADDSRPRAMVCSFSDVTSEREAEAALSYQATHDPLTRLPNRVSLLNHLRNQVEAGIGRLAVLFIDLDRFKLVNDSVGHMDADQVLRIVASRLLGACRGSEFVGRLAGDEFVVVLRDFDHPDDAHGFAERLANRVSEPIVLDSGREVLVTASIGVAVASPGGEDLDVEDLVQRSDAAMYQAKQAGRNRVERYHRALHEKALHRMMLRERLQEVINDDALDVAYQPVVDLATGTVLGFEALARWTLETEGPVPPSVFVPIAEEDGLIVDLGKQVLRRACTDFARWREGRPDSDDLTLAVNISTRQLGSELLIDAVVESLQLSGLAGRDLWLEVTESVLAAHEPTARRVLDGLRSLGVRLAVDDFGTGHSSLLSLQRYPVEMLKIDRSFVAGLGRDTGSEAIVAAVVGLASSLGLSAVAEGVETEAQRDRLCEMGCPLGQGYLFGRPGSLDRAASGS